MARTKSDISKNIRNSIKGSTSFSVDRNREAGKNMELSKTLQGISTFLETLSKNEQDMFKKLIAAVEEIPKNNVELQRQQKQIFDDLIKTSAVLKKAAEKETDPKKKKELESATSSMIERGTSIQKNIDPNPRGLREMIGAKKYGIDPREVRQKGLIRSVFSQAKREVFGGDAPSFSEQVESEKNSPDAESVEPAVPNATEPSKKSKKTLGEKTKDNLKGLENLTQTLKSILSEVTVMRKIVEGRIKFNANAKGGQYKDAATGKNIKKEDASRAGQGLRTKEELGKQLGLSAAEIKKTKLEDLEKQLESKQNDKNPSSKKQGKGKSFSETDNERNTNAVVQSEKGNLQEDEPYPQITTPYQEEARKKALLLMSGKAPGVAQKQKFDDAVDKQIAADDAKIAKAKVEANPNALRDVSKIDQNPFDEERFKTSGTDKDTEQKPVQGSTEKSGGDGGGILGAIGGIGGGLLSKAVGGAKKLLTRGKVPTGAAAKSAEKGAVKAAEKGGIKAAEKGAVKAAQKGGVKAAGKIATKALGKSLLKKLPLIGLAAGIGFGIQRAMKGDITGAMGEVLSGAASTIPGVGTAASVAIDAGLAARDIKNASDVESTPAASDSASMEKATNTMNPVVAQVQATKRQNIAAVENASARSEGSSRPSAPIINNVMSPQSAPAAPKSAPENPYQPSVRTADNSFLRYQDRRMTRIL